MASNRIGIIFLLLFATAQGVRDAYFGNVFQSVSFLVIAILSFGMSTLVFAGVSLVRKPHDIVRAFTRPRRLIALNLTTAAAWLCFFFGLRNLEPAVVATLFNGVGPIVVLVGGWMGWYSAVTHLRSIERLLYLGLAITLISLCGVVLANESGLKSSYLGIQALALISVIFGGVMITISYAFTKSMTDEGIGSDAVMAARFVVLLTIALVLEIGFGDPDYVPSFNQVPLLTVSAFALIVIPSFLVQSGVSRTSPLLANVFRALGPVFVFAIQQFDGRLQFSGATLACIACFCFFTISASAIRGWRETTRT